MAPPASSARVVFSGTMAGGEEFAFGYWCNWTGGTPDEAGFRASFSLYVDDVVTDLTSLVQNVLSAGDRVTQATGYYYAGGSTKAALQAAEELSIYGSGAPSLPNQCALVVSLRTGLPGRSRRGRMYLPGTGLTVTTGAPMQVTDAAAGVIADNVQDILEKGVPGGFSPHVVSPTLSAMWPVSQIIVDTKIDTQRRRGQSVVATSNVIRPIAAP